MGNSDHGTTYMREGGDDGELRPMETQNQMIQPHPGAPSPYMQQDIPIATAVPVVTAVCVQTAVTLNPEA